MPCVLFSVDSLLSQSHLWSQERRRKERPGSGCWPVHSAHSWAKAEFVGPWGTLELGDVVFLSFSLWAFAFVHLAASRCLF